MKSEISVVFNADRRSAAELNKAVREVKTPYVLMVCGAEEPDENTQEVLLEALQDPSVAAAVGKVRGHGKDRVMKALLKADFSDEPCVKDIHTMYLEGKANVLLNRNCCTLYRMSAFETYGMFFHDAFRTEVLVWTARALYGGARIAYVPEAAVDVTNKTGIGREFRRYFLLGVSEKYNIQYFGYNIPMAGCRIPEDAGPAVWPDTADYIESRTRIAKSILKSKGKPLAVLRLLLIKTAMKAGNTLGRKYLYLPESLPEHYLKLERKNEN